MDEAFITKERMEGLDITPGFVSCPLPLRPVVLVAPEDAVDHMMSALLAGGFEPQRVFAAAIHGLDIDYTIPLVVWSRAFGSIEALLSWLQTAEGRPVLAVASDAENEADLLEHFVRLPPKQFVDLCREDDLPRQLVARLDLLMRRSEAGGTRDPLTGLLGRHALKKNLRIMLEASSPADGIMAAWMLDLDGFKGVNDTFGHAAGDAALRAVATTVLGFPTLAETACRLGGDEFFGIIQGTSREYVAGILEELTSQEAYLRGT